MIFNMKMEDFCQKMWLVTEGYMSDAPHTVTDASVVSFETVLIALTMALLNALEIMAADVLKCVYYCLE